MSRLKEKVLEEKIFKKKDSLISLHKVSILLLCLAQITIKAIVTIQIIILKIDYYIKESISDGGI